MNNHFNLALLYIPWETGKAWADWREHSCIPPISKEECEYGFSETKRNQGFFFQHFHFLHTFNFFFLFYSPFASHIPNMLSLSFSRLSLLPAGTSWSIALCAFYGSQIKPFSKLLVWSCELRWWKKGLEVPST
ncbi:hypothetical protein XELAEV_18030482mg [Xenopus laevis]|uniref:Uncharacterized protein n=1 Tax=Xenopus laevis TaxID=8355 RepID=A0A974HET5_XENLA|nr:hypothetical protein XELAEV_18030482mg [Xenopus laevis]